MGNDEIKNQRSQKYFSDLTRVNCTQNQTGNVDDLNEKIALKVSISNIQKEKSIKRLEMLLETSIMMKLSL